MPIVFESPGPFSPAASQGGGAATQYSRDLPSLVAQQRTLAGLYEAAARLRQGGVGAGQDLRPQSAPGVAGGGGYGVPLAAPPRDDPLTQSENLRLQRLQNARSLIQQQVADGTLSAEDGNNMLLQAQTGIDPLKGQQERAQAKLRQQQTEALQQQVQMQARAEQEQSSYRSRSMQDRVGVVRGSDGEVLAHVIDTGPTGRPHVIERQPGRPGVPAALLNTVHHQVDQLIQRELHEWSDPVRAGQAPEWTRTPEAVERHRQDMVRRRLEGIGREPGFSQGGQPAGQPGQAQEAPEQTRQRLNAQSRLDAIMAPPGTTVDRGQVGETPSSSPLPQSMRNPAGFLTGGALGPQSRLAVGDVFRDLNEAPRPERHNEASGVSWDRARSVLGHLTQVWNNSPRPQRMVHGQLRSIGQMADLVGNATDRGRELTRHELAHYNRLLSRLSQDDQRAWALEPTSNSRS